MPDEWPFADPENVIVFTLNRVVRGETSILRVSHDEDDGGWQFLDNGDFVVEDALLVCLKNVTELDPSLLELADLPLGWVAERASPGQPWQRSSAFAPDECRQKVVSDIQKFGWHVVMLPEDEEGPAFAYSIGLFQTFAHPEILIFGLDLSVMHQIINLIGEEVRHGRKIAAGDFVSDLIEGFDVRFVEIAEKHFPEYLGFGCRFCEGERFPALQCVWPDRQGHFPTEIGYPEALRQRQPLLDS